MKIYTITMVEKIQIPSDQSLPKLPDFGDRRCIGYYPSYKEAVEAIMLCDLYRKDYEYCIIEEIYSGVFKDTPHRWIFKRFGDEKEGYNYFPITEPKEIANVRNFGIG